METMWRLDGLQGAELRVVVRSGGAMGRGRWRAVALLGLLGAIPAFAAPVAAAASPTLVSAARDQTRNRVVYDGSYVRLGYPMGDVPPDRGVCTDVVIR